MFSCKWAPNLTLKKYNLYYVVKVSLGGSLGYKSTEHESNVLTSPLPIESKKFK